MAMALCPPASPMLASKREAILESRRAESRAYQQRASPSPSPPPMAMAAASSPVHAAHARSASYGARPHSVDVSMLSSASGSFSASAGASAPFSSHALTTSSPFASGGRNVLRPTTAAPGKSVPVQSNYPTALSSHIGPHKPRPQFDIVSNRHLNPSLKPKTSPALPSWEYSWHKAAAVDQTINMVNWNESKRLDDPSPVASRRAALSKLHIKERSSTLPVDIVSWTPKSPGSLAAGARQTAVAAGQSHAAPVAVAVPHHHQQQRPMTGSAVRANMSRPSSSHGGGGSINLSIQATKIKFGPVHTGRPF